MKTFNRYLQKYLAYGFPLVIALITWECFETQTQIEASGSLILKAIFEIGSWNFMLWFLSLVIFMVLLVVRKDTQEQSIKFIAGMKERDEREELIVALAARTSFVATTGFLIFLLFISLFSLNIAKNPNSEVNRHKSSLTVGVHFSDVSSEAPIPSLQPNGLVFEHRGIPLSKTSLILLILAWQLGSFRLKVRKELS
jgi:hypothetical protein